MSSARVVVDMLRDWAYNLSWDCCLITVLGHWGHWSHWGMIMHNSLMEFWLLLLIVINTLIWFLNNYIHSWLFLFQLAKWVHKICSRLNLFFGTFSFLFNFLTSHLSATFTLGWWPLLTWFVFQYFLLINFLIHGC